jgi:hypothetical protein
MRVIDLVYLVRTEDRVILQKKRPKEVSLLLLSGKWVYRDSIFIIGEDDRGRILYADNWIGPIGVFDPTNRVHLKEMMTQFRAHTISLTVDQMKQGLADVADQRGGKIHSKKPKPVLSFADVINAAGEIYNHQL